MPADGSTTHKLAYRPALDGVRAIAVYLVVVFHAEMALWSGGFVGVDIFFVLSGYLVTRVILVDLEHDSFRLVDFYARRVRRLLPAALVTLVVVAFVWLCVASPIDRRLVLDDARAATLYVANWHFAAEATDYFAANENPTPLLHFWSLSVEEQFYVVWPLLVLAIWRIGARTRDPARLLGIVASVGSLASLVALWRTTESGDVSMAYYGTHTRAYQLLGGAVLAVLLHRWKRTGSGDRLRVATAVQIASLGALVFLATDRWDAGPSSRGVAAAAATLAGLAALEANPMSLAARALSVRPLVHLGRISYATYLWHFPILVTLVRFADVPAGTRAVFAAVLATALASLSNDAIEMPVRTARSLMTRSRVVVAGGLVASLVTALVLLPLVLQSDRLPVVTARGSSLGPVPAAPVDDVELAGFDVEAAAKLPAGSPGSGPATSDSTCTEVEVTECVLVDGSGPTVLLMGDSHAGMLVPAFRSIAKQEDLRLVIAVKSGCPWQQTLSFTRGDPECWRYQEAWYSTVVPGVDPDVIVVATRGTDHAIGSTYGVESSDESVPDDPSSLLSITTERTVRSLLAPGRTVVVVEPVPVSTENTRSCLSGARWASECAFLADDASAAELHYRSFASSTSGVVSLDIDPLVCPRLPVCDPIVDGILVRLDHDHISAAWSAHIADDLLGELTDRGVLDRPATS